MNIHDKKGFTPIKWVLPNRRRRYLTGFTLIEMVVVIGLVAILSAVVSTMLVASLSSYRTKRQSVDLEDKASAVLRDFEKSTRAASKIVMAEPDQLTFLRYFDLTSASPTQVRYFMDGDQFKIGLTQPSGIAPAIVYPIQNEKIDLIVDNVTNGTTLFKYYNSNGGLIPGPVEIATVRMIEINIALDKDPNKPPTEITETTKVNLRNMKDNL